MNLDRIEKLIQASESNVNLHKKLLGMIEAEDLISAERVGFIMTKIALRNTSIINSLYEELVELILVNESMNLEQCGENSRTNKFNDDRLDRILSLFENNVKSIAVSEKMKGDDRLTNERVDVSTTDIVNEYLSGMTLTDIGKRHNMSYNGIKLRLQRAGVYKGSKKDYRGNKK